MRPLRSAGGTGVSTSTFGKVRTDIPSGYHPSPPQPGYSLRPRRSETYLLIIGRGKEVEDSRFRIRQRLLDRGLGHGGHDFESGRVRVESILGEVHLQQALVVDQGVEIVQINAAA